MPNRIEHLFSKKKKNILSIYFTAGFPHLEDTTTIIESLQESGADLIEIGMPFSDPLADGPVIQNSSTKAIQNGMTIPVLFDQLKDIRAKVDIPLILMGYLNPVMQYGVENFCKKAAEIGIDGVIIPDLPLKEYLKLYETMFESHNLKNIFLITPQTSEERVREIDSHSNSFIYMVSSASTTGTKEGTSTSQYAYFDRINSYNLHNPRLIGFGIKDKSSFDKACEYAQGAIIGTAFIQHIERATDVKKSTSEFVRQVLN